MKCEVRTHKNGRGTAFELLPADRTDKRQKQCTNKASKLVDWGNGHSTYICLKHDAEALGLEYTKA
jgi:hypothetical protein